MKKKTDGGHEIPEEDLREMEQDGGQEVPEGAKTQTEQRHRRDIVDFVDRPGLFMHGKNGARQKLTKRQRANVSVTKPKNTQKVKSVCRKPRTVSMNYLGIMQKGRLIRMLWK